MDYRIEKAGLKDLDTTATLFNLYRVFYRQEDDYERCKQFIAERLDHDQSHIFVLYVGEKAVGFVQLYKLYHYIRLKKQWLLSDLYVHPDYRGAGTLRRIDRPGQRMVRGNGRLWPDAGNRKNKRYRQQFISALRL